MGLAFLNKKSFHTGSFQNIEKVWKAEQKEKELERKVKEANKKLKEERHYEEIKKIQVLNGLLPKSRLQRLDWMYEGGAIKNMSSEEYLLGKPQEETESDKHGGKEWRPVLCKESTANTANESFTKTHEDPLFLIKQEALRRQRDILQDPEKLQRLQQKLEGLKDGRSSKSRSRSRRHSHH
jgi:hypothetical protein